MLNLCPPRSTSMTGGHLQALWKSVWLLNYYNKEIPLWFFISNWLTAHTHALIITPSPSDENFIHHPGGLSHALVMPSDSALLSFH